MVRAHSIVNKPPYHDRCEQPGFPLDNCEDRWYDKLDTKIYIESMNLQCTDDDNRSYRNVCNMSLISFSLAVIFPPHVK